MARMEQGYRNGFESAETQAREASEPDPIAMVVVGDAR